MPRFAKGCWAGFAIQAPLIAILALAAALRFYGLRWGLPNSQRSYSYHPDEFLTIGASFVAIYLHRSFDPRFYNYPSLYLYLSALAMAVGFGYGVISDEQGVYLCARVVTASMGVGAVAATYWAGMTLFSNRTAALLAALFLCIAPLHVQHSHFATVDVPSTLFVALCLGCSGLILNRGTWRDYIVAGAMAGFAAGTKYNAGLVVLSPIAAHFLSVIPLFRSAAQIPPVRSDNVIPPLRRGGRGGGLLATLGCAIIAFIVSTPGSVLRTQEFLHGLTYEMRHASAGHGLVFAGTGNGFAYTFTSSLSWGLGPLLALLVPLVVIWRLCRGDRFGLVLLAFAVPYYALISVSQVRFARYTLPLLPALALLVGYMVWKWYHRLRAPGRLMTIGRVILVFFCVGAILSSAYFTALFVALFELESAQDRAARWIFAHVARGSSIGVMDVPWFYTPPLSKSLGLGALPRRREAAYKAPYRFVVFSDYMRSGGWWTDGARPEWVILSDYETDDALRLRGAGSLPKDARREVDRRLSDIELVKKHYIRRACFGYEAFESREWGTPPHDMRYTDPSITIYEIRK